MKNGWRLQRQHVNGLRDWEKRWRRYKKLREDPVIRDLEFTNSETDKGKRGSF